MANPTFNVDELSAEQKYALRMNGFLTEDGKVARQPDQITKAGLLVYNLEDSKTDHQDTLLVVYPEGATSTFSHGMNLPDGVKV